jgi:predicted ATPase
MHVVSDELTPLMDGSVGSRLMSGRLPIYPDPVIGRTREIRAVADLLDRGSERLVTLTGPGGVGKTRIAVAAAETAAAQFTNGVRWLPMDAVPETKDFFPAVRMALGIQSPTPTAGADITDHLQEEQTLLVIDQAEHILGACSALCAALLASTRKLRILLTSREALQIPGELPFSVRPLPLPALHGEHRDLEQAPASRLFMARATLPATQLPPPDPRSAPGLVPAPTSTPDSAPYQ